MNRNRVVLSAFCIGLACWIGLPTPRAGLAESAAPGNSIALTVQRRDEAGKRVREPLAIVPARTAVVVIDMWDRHWCATYTARVANLVPRMNHTLDAARALGMQVVFAPSDVLDFYRDAPQRAAMLRVPQHPEPRRVGFTAPAPPGPTDFCECGPGRPCIPVPGKAAWTRQHPALKIAAGDLIADCNNGGELLNLCAERKIDTLVYMGVASNICVQFRNMGIRNMKDHGLRTLVVSDLVEAITSNGVDENGKKNLNFTPAGGTARIQAHIERFVAPTLGSRQILAAAGRSSHNADPRPHVVLVSAEAEYESHATLARFAKEKLEPRVRCRLLVATGPEGSGRDDVPGLEAVDDADLVAIYMRRRSLPVVEMDHLERYIRAGRPLIVLRTSAAAFQYQQDPKPGHVVWSAFDEEVLGCKYQTYNPKARVTGCDVWQAPGAAVHPILSGVAERWHSPSWIYRQRPLAKDVTMLLTGRWSTEDPDEPVAWTRAVDGGRMFYTTLGHPDDFRSEPFVRMLANAVDWALRPAP